jgi:hypothetical protein
MFNCCAFNACGVQKFNCLRRSIACGVQSLQRSRLRVQGFNALRSKVQGCAFKVVKI